MVMVGVACRLRFKDILVNIVEFGFPYFYSSNRKGSRNATVLHPALKLDQSIIHTWSTVCFGPARASTQPESYPDQPGRRT